MEPGVEYTKYEGNLTIPLVEEPVKGKDRAPESAPEERFDISKAFH